ncbi:hypothetical protein JCM15519_04360 [Fundidesulfovibrio butyratiphilus]
MDQRYRYTGPCSAVSLPADAAHPKGRDVRLSPGAEVVLPDDNAYVRTLITKKLLTCLGPVEVQSEPISPATEPTEPASASTVETASAATED